MNCRGLARIDTHSVHLQVFVEPFCASTVPIPPEFRFPLLLPPVSPNMESHSRICFFHSLSGFKGLPGVVPLSIVSVDVNNISNVLNFAFRGPVPEVFFFPVAGLTNRVPVRDSRAGGPLRTSSHRPSFNNSVLIDRQPSAIPS